MKNVLIPTDLSIQSLRLIPAVCAHFGEEELSIILVHPMEPDNTISALLRHANRSRECRLHTPEFREACEVLRNRFDNRIVKLIVEFYYGATKSYLKSYVDGRNIDLIALTNDFGYGMPSKHSRNVINTFSKPGLPVKFLPAAKRRSQLLAPESSLADLLYA